MILLTLPRSNGTLTVDGEVSALWVFVSRIADVLSVEAYVTSGAELMGVAREPQNGDSPARLGSALHIKRRAGIAILTIPAVYHFMARCTIRKKLEIASASWTPA